MTGFKLLLLGLLIEIKKIFRDKGKSKSKE